MSIYAYVGLPGHGKSYGVVENQILPMLKHGRRVVTNIPLKVERIRETIETGEIVELPLDRVIGEPDCIFEYCTPGSVVVIDEAWKIFDTKKQDKWPQAYKTLLAEHRHMVDEGRNSMVIVLVVQDLSMIGNFARQLVEQTYMHVKLSALGSDKSYRVDIYTGSVTGQRPPAQKLVRSTNGRYRPEVYSLYDSHTMAAGKGEGANEKTGDRRALLWKRPIFTILPIAVLLFVVFGVPRLLAAFGGSTGSDAREGASVASPRAPAARVAGTVAPVRERPIATVSGGRVWRFAGTIEFPSSPGRGLVFLTAGDVDVSLPLERFCDRTVEGWFICRYEGQEISSEVTVRRQIPRGAVAASSAVDSVSYGPGT